MPNMRAARVHNYGGPEVLQFEDAPRPTPGSGEMLIRVHAAYEARAGHLKDYIPLPLHLDVTHGSGAYAEYAIVNEKETALKPKSIDHVHAAAIPVAAVTAWRGVI